MAAKGPKRWQNDDGNIKEAEQVQKKKRADIKIWKCKRKKNKSLSQKLLGRVKRQSFNCDTKSSKFKVKDDSKSMPMRRLKKMAVKEATNQRRTRQISSNCITFQQLLRCHRFVCEVYHVDVVGSQKDPKNRSVQIQSATESQKWQVNLYLST